LSTNDKRTGREDVELEEKLENLKTSLDVGENYGGKKECHLKTKGLFFIQIGNHKALAHTHMLPV